MTATMCNPLDYCQTHRGMCDPMYAATQTTRNDPDYYGVPCECNGGPACACPDCDHPDCMYNQDDRGDDLDYCRHGYIARTCRACNSVVDVLDEYPSLGPLFVQAGMTASELDKFLTMMEEAITYKETPEIMREDMASLHGDAVLIYADMVGGGNV